MSFLAVAMVCSFRLPLCDHYGHFVPQTASECLGRNKLLKFVLRAPEENML